MFKNFYLLSGHYTKMSSLPEKCPECGSKSYYKQPDFKKSIGLSMVVLASLGSCVLFYYRMNWFLVWTPMLCALILDRLFSYLSSDVVICYDCEEIFRGIPQEQIDPLDAFDLEAYDRHKYKNAHKE